MSSNLLKFKISELIKLKDGIKERELEINEAMTQILVAKKTISQIIRDHSDENKDITVYLPKETFDKIKLNTQNDKNKFNWKKVALEILKISKEPLSTSMLYERAKIKYPLELADKFKAIRGFSAALYYLKAEGKIGQIKNNRKNFYGTENIVNKK